MLSNYIWNEHFLSFFCSSARKNKIKIERFLIVLFQFLVSDFILHTSFLLWSKSIHFVIRLATICLLLKWISLWFIPSSSKNVTSFVFCFVVVVFIIGLNTDSIFWYERNLFFLHLFFFLLSFTIRFQLISKEYVRLTFVLLYKFMREGAKLHSSKVNTVLYFHMFLILMNGTVKTVMIFIFVFLLRELCVKNHKNDQF